MSKHTESWQSSGKEDDANAEFIVMACNAYEELLAACWIVYSATLKRWFSIPVN